MRRREPPFEEALCRSHGLFETDEAGSGLLQREPGARFSREQDGRRHAQVGFMADADHDGVRRQGVEQRKEFLWCSPGGQFVADMNGRPWAEEAVKDVGRLARAQQGAGQEMGRGDGKVAQSPAGLAGTFDAPVRQRAVLLLSVPFPPFDRDAMSKKDAVHRSTSG